MRQLPHIAALVVCTLFVGACSIPEARVWGWHMVTRADMMATCLTRDDSRKLRELIDNGLPIDNYYNWTGNSDRLTTVDDEWNNSSRTLLLQSLCSGAAECAGLLLDYKADVSKVDGVGNNALMLSACLPEDVTVKMMDRIVGLSTFDVNATNRLNVTALGIAIAENNGKCVDWLLRNGADYGATSHGVYVHTSDGGYHQDARPIWFDAMSARQDIFETFMELPGIDFRTKDGRGMGILYWLKVRLKDYDERFKRLIGRGAGLCGREGERVIINNMSFLGDCEDRVAMICSYIDAREPLEAALRRAVSMRRLGCIRVIKDRLSRMTRTSSK
ncbi:MAG: ankyrin repeat domain-containing protein [Kiritimatiellia bacterium]